RKQIEQALTNLVRNAVEALAGHERAPRIVTLGGAARGESVEMHVSDNGPGVPAETRERLFEPFFTTKTAGTGLGLLVCLSIAELHGGHVRLDRTGPEGSCFVLELPLRPPEIPGVRA
ncbi:MAG TPA: ATP-binding protein, partial [Thermoanaerobaculia bacterium]|nr:ATP-binding protein [Thermoanaerobaculia bacterium]